MASPAEVVAQQFSLAQGYANDASTKVDSFAAALNGALYTAPTISVTWTDPSTPTIPSMPATPTAPTIDFNAPTAPTELSLTAPTIAIDAFAEVDPTLNIPTVYTPSYGTAPTVPAIGAVTVPSAPTLPAVTTPTYLSLTTPTFAGVDLRPDYLTNLETIPTLSLVAPTPYSHVVDNTYASALLSNVTATLNTRLAGGTGLAPAVEQAIWDRSRVRETATAQANIDEVMRNSEAFGFHLPTGALAAQLRKTQQEYYDKLSGLSRDVAIKQAELEQENLKQTISQGIELEGRLIDYSYKVEQLTFESAKMTAENAVQIYNAQVEGFKAKVSAYSVYATAYKSIIDGAMAQVEVYKAQLQAEQTKASVNNMLVEQYKAQIEANMSLVEIFKAEVGAANALIGLEQAKIGAAGEQIKAYVATVNAETSKVEAYKAGVQAEMTKVDVYRVKADAFRAVTGAQAEKARLDLGYYTAQVQAKSAEWESYRARVSAEQSRMQALAQQSGALWEGFKAQASSVESVARTNTQIWEASIRKAEAVQSLGIQAGKANNDAIIATNNARLDAAKVGAQVYAQLTSSAYSIIHASAGVSAGSAMQVSYAYKNDTASTAPTVVGI
jgi:hypothetical protein